MGHNGVAKSWESANFGSSISALEAEGKVLLMAQHNVKIWFIQLFISSLCFSLLQYITPVYYDFTDTKLQTDLL